MSGKKCRQLPWPPAIVSVAIALFLFISHFGPPSRVKTTSESAEWSRTRSDAVNCLAISATALGVKVDLEKLVARVADRRVSVAELSQLAREIGMTVDVSRISGDFSSLLPPGSVVYLEDPSRGGGVFSIVLAAYDDGVVLLDGANLDARSISSDYFLQLWSGIRIQFAVRRDHNFAYGGLIGAVGYWAIAGYFKWRKP